MKRLYNDTDERYVDEGSNLDYEISQAIRPIMERYISEGYSIRDVISIAQEVVWGVGLEFLLTLKCEVYDKKNTN